MTQPAADTLEKEKQDRLFLTDAELIRWMNVPEPIARAAIRLLEAKRGFPKKQELFGDRRYRRAVEDYLDDMFGVKSKDRRG